MQSNAVVCGDLRVVERRELALMDKGGYKSQPTTLNAVLITGATGFAGTNLAGYLAEQQAFRPVPLNLRADWGREIPPYYSTIVHLAGKAHDVRNVSAPEEYYSVNFELTRNLYDAFLRSEAKKFVFISSVKAVADSVEGVLSAGCVPAPKSHYGKSKLMAEEYIQNQPLPEGKACYILRPCMIHGPGNRGNLNLLYNMVSKGIPYPLAAFDNKRSFLSVENFCFIIKEILERDDIPSGIYHVADDDALSTAEVVGLLSESLGKKPRLWHVPKWAIEFAAKVGDKLRLPINTERLGKLTENYVVSNEQIKKALGKGLPVSAREGILRTARSFEKK